MPGKANMHLKYMPSSSWREHCQPLFFCNKLTHNERLADWIFCIFMYYCSHLLIAVYNHQRFTDAILSNKGLQKEFSKHFSLKKGMYHSEWGNSCWSFYE